MTDLEHAGRVLFLRLVAGRGVHVREGHVQEERSGRRPIEGEGSANDAKRPNQRGFSAPGVHALVDKIGDKFVVFGRECGEVQRLLQHSGVLGVGLPRGREKGG